MLESGAGCPGWGEEGTGWEELGWGWGIEEAGRVLSLALAAGCPGLRSGRTFLQLGRCTF